MLDDGDGVAVGDLCVRLVAGSGLAHRGLQQDGRLALVQRVGADAQKGAGRVEQAADGRGHGRVQAAVDHLLAHIRLLAQGCEGVGRARMLQQVERPQRAVGHAQRMPHRCRAARQGHVGEVREPLERALVGEQHLTSPDGAIGPVARAVERDAAHRAGQPVLAHHRHDVGMVVLHLRERQAVHAALIVGPFRREVLGMQVAGQAAGLDLEQRLVTVLRLEPRVVGLRVLHVADVLRHERLGVSRERERVLLLGTHGEDRPRVNEYFT